MKDGFNRDIEIGDIVFYSYNCWHYPIMGIVSKKFNNWFQLKYASETSEHIINTTVKKPEVSIIVNELYSSEFYKPKIDKLVELSGIPRNTKKYEQPIKQEQPEEWK